MLLKKISSSQIARLVIVVLLAFQGELTLTGSGSLTSAALSDGVLAPVSILAVQDETQENYIIYVPLPTDVSREQFLRADRSLRDRLHGITIKHLAFARELYKEAANLDRVVIFVDHDGRPILPDLDTARSRLSNSDGPSVPATLASNELTFTFDSPSYPWSAGELVTLNTALNDLYPIAKSVYGNPAFNITVNIRKDPTIIGVAGFYNPSSNEISVRDASLDVLCHEMIHAFRDDDLVGLGSWEEGMTRAAEVEVFNRSTTYTHPFDQHHSYTYDVYYEGLNRQTIGSQNGNLFSGYVSALLRYQLAGYAWAKALLENPDFLRNFNNALYIKNLTDPTTTTEFKLLEIATNVQSSVEGQGFLAWYRQQGVLNNNPPKGYFLYQRINQFTVDYFYRSPSGSEIMQPNATIQWAAYDYKGMILTSGSSVTSANGSTTIFDFMIPPSSGYIKVVVSASTPNGTISDTALSFAGGYNGSNLGVFGVVEGADSGTVTITPLDVPVPTTSVNVLNGSFSAPSLATAKGRFLLVFTDTKGQSFAKKFNKDASNYFVLMTITYNIYLPLILGNP